MKIPEDRIPYKVTVNGVTTVLESGAELTVSASVQDAIEATEDFPADPLPVDKPWECGYPAPKSGDAGKVLTVGEDGKPGWYEASGGTEVIANPTLAGTEADLTGLQVGDTKYKVPAGGGGGGGALRVALTTEDMGQTYESDKTWQEVYDAVTTGAGAFAVIDMGQTVAPCYFVDVHSGDSGYGANIVGFAVQGQSTVSTFGMVFSASTANSILTSGK